MTGLSTNIEHQDTKSTKVSEEPRKKHIPITQESINTINEEFYKSAARGDNAPVYKIYEGNQRTAFLKCAIETNETEQPAVVSVSGNRIDNVVNNDSNIRSGDMNNTFHVPPHLSMYNASSPFVKKDKKTNKKKKKEESLSPNDNKSSEKDLIHKNSTSSITNNINGEQNNSIDVECRFSHATKYALNKSFEYIHDVQKISKSHNERSRKMNADEDEGDGGQTYASKDHLPKLQTKPKSEKKIAFSATEVKIHDGNRGMKSVQSAPQLLPSLPLHGTNNMEVEHGVHNNENTEDNTNNVISKVQGKFVKTLEDSMEGFQNKTSWENDIAKYILSMYATTKMIDRPSTSAAVLEMMDNEHSHDTKELLEDGLLENLQDKRKSVEIAAKRPPSRKKRVKKSKGEDSTGRSSPKSLTTSDFCVKNIDPTSEMGMKDLQKKKQIDRKSRDEMHTTKSHPDKEAVRPPTKAFPIWFVGSGDIYAEWVSLPNGERVQSHVDTLREKKRYKEYCVIISEILEECWIDSLYLRNATAMADSNITSKIVSKSDQKLDLSRFASGDKVVLEKEELALLWRQLVLTANAFATILIERKDFSQSMQILQLADAWTLRDDIFSPNIRLELKSYVNNTLANYFFKKKMTRASLNHTKLALAAHKKLGNLENVAMTLLHYACCEYQVSKFKDAHRVINIASLCYDKMYIFVTVITPIFLLDSLRVS